MARTSVICFTFLILAIGSTCGIPAIQTELESFLKENGPSQYFSAVQLSYLLHDSSEAVNFHAGTMSLDSKTNIDDDSLFGWGSITKEFTTSLLFILKSQGKFDFESTVYENLPEYFDSPVEGAIPWPDAWKSVTVTQLLNMTSGIPDSFNSVAILVGAGVLKESFYEVLGEAYSLADIIQLGARVHNDYFDECQKVGACFEPGTKWHYSNTDYTISGLIAEKLFGNVSLPELYAKYILPETPSDSNTFYADAVLPKEILEKMPEAMNNWVHPTDPLNVTDWSWYFMGPSGGLIGNTKTLVSLIRKLFRTGIQDVYPASTWGSNVIQTTAKIAQDPKDCESGCYGLGIGLKNMEGDSGVVYSYLGEPLGYRTFYVYYPCYDFTLAFSVNSAISNNAAFGPYIIKFANMVRESHPEAFVEVGGDQFCPGTDTNVDLGFLQNVQAQE